MGYESRIKIYNFDKGFYELIAEINMSKIGYGDFYDLFDKKVEDDAYLYTYKYVSDVSNEYAKDYYVCEPTNTDAYDDVCTYTNDIVKVLEYARKQYAEDGYRRWALLIGILENLNPTDWDEIRIVHYGY